MMHLIGANGMQYPLTQWPVTIGRYPNNLIVLADESVSGNHARLEQQGGNVILTDCNSTNGCWVNGNRVFSAQKLGNGDRLRIGNITFSFVQEAAGGGVCLHCGGSIRPGAKFCPVCGQMVLRPGAAPPPPPAYNPPPPVYNPPPPPVYNPPPPVYNASVQIYDPFPLVNNNAASALYNPPISAAPVIKPAGRDRIHFREALNYPRSDSSWISKMILGGLIYCIPILGFILLQGYLIELSRRVINNDSEKLPQWDNWGQKIRDGLTYFILVAITVGGTSLIFMLPSLFLLPLDEELGLIAIYLGALLGSSLSAFFLPVMLGRYATTGKFSATLQFGAMLAQIRPNFGHYVGNFFLFIIFLWLGMFWLMFVASLISITVLLAIPVTLGLLTYVSVFQTHLITQLYQLVE